MAAAQGKLRALIRSRKPRACANVRRIAERRFNVDQATAGEVELRILIEAPLPPPHWPSWLRISPKLWGFFARFWWWFFNHHEGQETRRQAEVRADKAAAMLEELAASGQDVVVTAHGFFNFMIGRALKARGWRMASSQGYKYWSIRRFERT